MPLVVYCWPTNSSALFAATESPPLNPIAARSPRVRGNGPSCVRRTYEISASAATSNR